MNLSHSFRSIVSSGLVLTALAAVGCAPAPAPAPAGAVKPQTGAPVGPGSSAVGKPPAVEDQSGSTTGATEKSEN